MSTARPSKALAEVCEIKPPKSEAKRSLKDSDFVSFAPMEDLGIDQKFLESRTERTLGQVAGSYTYFADGDVLLAKITPCFENGKLGIARRLTNGIGFGSSEYIVLRPSDELNNEYLYYFLLQDSFRASGVKTMSGAVGHKRVSKEFVERAHIPLPPLPEQQRIVAILDVAFAGLATASANAEKNLKNARELFDSYLSSIFTRKGEDWSDRILGDLCELISGQHIDAKDYNTNGKGLGYLTGPSDFGPVHPIISKWTEVPKRTATKDDILITVKGSGVGSIKGAIFARYNGSLQTFLEFVLGQYVTQGVEELDQEKLSHLLELKYHTIDDAAAKLGGIPKIRDTFVGFQQYLYADPGKS